MVLRLLDAVDDTALLSKAIVGEMANADTIASLLHHPQGCKPYLFLLAPRSNRYFSPQLLADLRNAYKQSTATRNAQKDEMGKLLDMVSSSMAQAKAAKDA